MKLVQIIRNKGYSLRAEEEALMTRLIGMDRDLAKPSVFRGRINEIYAQVQQQKDANRLYAAGGEEGYSLADPNAMKPVVQVIDILIKGSGRAGKGIAAVDQCCEGR
jgi:nuclear pore complex protein Nup54